MKNIAEILAELGLEVPAEKQAELDRLMGENYRTVADYQKQTAKTTKAEGERDEYKSLLETAQTALKDLEGKDVAELEKQIQDWRKKAEDATAAAARKLAERDYEDALAKKLSGLKFTSEAAKASITEELRKKELKLDNGELLGFDDAIKAIRERDAAAFLDESNPPARFTSAFGRSQTPPARKPGEPATMRDAIAAALTAQVKE